MFESVGAHLCLGKDLLPRKRVEGKNLVLVTIPGVQHSPGSPCVVEVPVEIDTTAHGQNESQTERPGSVLTPETVGCVAVLVPAKSLSTIKTCT